MGGDKLQHDPLVQHQLIETESGRLGQSRLTALAWSTCKELVAHLVTDLPGPQAWALGRSIRRQSGIESYALVLLLVLNQREFQRPGIRLLTARHTRC